jgi:ribosomal protein L40E
MECSYCGASNPAGSNYCRTCGKRILTDVVCTHCGETLKKGSNFCNVCGTKVNQAKGASAGVQRSNKFRDHSKLSSGRGAKKRGKKSAIPSFVPIVIVIVVIAGALIWVLSQTPGSRSSRSQGIGASARTVQGWDPEVQTVAANFNCPCGECGVTPLDECTCDSPRGAVEVKTYISDLLDQGLSKFEVVKLVEEQYGNRR